MGQRVTVVIENERHSKLHVLQGKAIGRYDGNVSFSDVVNFGLAFALEKGFSVEHILKSKKENSR